MDITGIGTAATAAKDILGMFFPDKTEEEKAKIAGVFGILQSQIAVNQAEAQSQDPLQHWRGALGWVCALAYLNNFVLVPWGQAFGLHVPTLNIESLSTLTLGMLGLGGMHVYQQTKS